MLEFSLVADGFLEGSGEYHRNHFVGWGQLAAQ